MSKTYWAIAFLSITGLIFTRNTCYGQATANQPNIVFILADDMGYGDVKSFNPEGKIQTPYIDKLASGGMKFTNAHASSSVCTPSRYSILTGRYPWRSALQEGVLGGYAKPLIGKDRLTVASFLKQNGYTTSLIGKWHLGMDWPLKDGYTSIKSGWEIDYAKPIQEGPLTRGFDYYFGISASLDMAPFIFIENDRTVGIPDVTKKIFNRDGPSRKEFEPEDVLPVFTQKAKETIIKNARAVHPFFLYFALPSPHTPIVPDGRFKGKSKLAPYADYVMETDWAVGQVMQTLDSLGINKNTIVFFASDNGFAPYVFSEYNLEEMGHYPSYIFRGYKSDIWDGGHRVPLIVSWPGRIKAGTGSNDLVSLTDFMATCAAILNVKIPGNAAEDSYSLLPYLSGKVSNPVRPAIVYQSIDGNFSIQKGKWKLELCPGSGGWAAPRNKQAYQEGLPAIQLYDMQVDPSEKTNVQAQHPEIVKELTALLEQYIENGRSTSGQQLNDDSKVDIWKKQKYVNQQKKTTP